jgi:hypothetical protein
MNEVYNTQMFTVSSSEDDPIEALVRRGAKVMLQAALEQEVSEYLERARHQRSETESEFRGYRNGHAPERKLTIGSGTIKVKTPRVSDVPEGNAEFASQIARALSATLALLAAGVSQVVYRRFGDQRLRTGIEMFDGHGGGALTVHDFSSECRIQS